MVCIGIYAVCGIEFGNFTKTSTLHYDPVRYAIHILIDNKTRDRFKIMSNSSICSVPRVRHNIKEIRGFAEGPGDVGRVICIYSKTLSKTKAGTAVSRYWVCRPRLSCSSFRLQKAT